MGRVAAIGAPGRRLGGFALAGALVLPAEDDDAVRGAWAALPADVAVVVLTAAAAAALGRPPRPADAPLTVVMPS